MAAPYLVLLATGGALLAERKLGIVLVDETLLVQVHRFAGAALPALVFLAFWGGNRRVLMRNVRLALTWRGEDLLWLLRTPIPPRLRRRPPPAAAKFNAGQKLNLLAQMILVPLFVVTGAAIWWRSEALLSWLVHVVGFFVALPLILGHLYLALLHPSTRKGLSGIFTGFVDARWARHHHPREYGRNPDA